MFWLWQALHLRGRAAAFLTLGATVVIFWPEPWGSQRLGFEHVRESGYQWIPGLALLFFALVTIIRFIDWIESVLAAAKKHDHVIFAMNSLPDDEREIMNSALTSGSNTIHLRENQWKEGATLLKKGLIERVDGTAEYTNDSYYVIPMDIWRVMIGRRFETRPEQLPTQRDSTVRIAFDMLGMKAEFYRRPIPTEAERLRDQEE